MTDMLTLHHGRCLSPSVNHTVSLVPSSITYDQLTQTCMLAWWMANDPIISVVNSGPKENCQSLVSFSTDTNFIQLLEACKQVNASGLNYAIYLVCCFLWSTCMLFIRWIMVHTRQSTKWHSWTEKVAASFRLDVARQQHRMIAPHSSSNLSSKLK